MFSLNLSHSTYLAPTHFEDHPGAWGQCVELMCSYSAIFGVLSFDLFDGGRVDF